MNAVDRDAFSGWGAVVHVMYVFLFTHYSPEQLSIDHGPMSTFMSQLSGSHHHSDTKGPNGLRICLYIPRVDCQLFYVGGSFFG